VGSEFEHNWGEKNTFRILLTTCGVNVSGDKQMIYTYALI
jgi:hypothetical protein